MVVAAGQQHAAIGVGAGIVGVLEGVAGAVDAGALAVPDGEHAIDLGPGNEIELLGAPDGGRRHILVEPRPEENVVLFQMLGRFP